MRNTRTRRVPREEQKTKDRAEKMTAYLQQLDDKLENDIKFMTAQTHHMCDSIYKLYNVQILRLPKWLLDSSLDEICERKNAVQAEDEEVAITKKLRLKKGCSTKPRTKTTRKTQPKTLTELQTPILNAAIGFSNVFTPKFDPRVPITPATGLRSIKPGEKFVMMSMSGSPLMTEANSIPAVISLDDGKTIAITADMDIPLDVNEDTKAKLAYTQKRLAAMKESSR